jgi:hypothetical protein
MYTRLTLYSGEPNNFSRNAAMTGVAAAAGAGGAYAATRPHDNVDDSMHTDRSFPLSGGAIAPHSDHRPPSSTYSGDVSVPAGRADHIAGLNTGTKGGVGAESGEAALANLGLERHSAIDHSEHSHEFNGDPCETEPAEKTLPFIPGPHATVAANMLDPHVPGEFPLDNGLDPHSDHNTLGFGQTSQHNEPSSSQHIGRDAALVEGAGAAGIGAHEALKQHTSPVQQPASSHLAGSGVGYPAPLGSHEALADRTLPPQQPAYSSPSQHSFASDTQHEPSSNDHHLGRNAALAGGAGAASLGAYASTRDHSEPNIAQQSQGSSALNPSTSQSSVHQPIVQTQTPQHITGNPLTGAREPQQEHHYGRDAALVGGAGAVGYGANEYPKDHNTTGPASDGTDGNVTDPRTGLPMNVGKYGVGTGGTDANPAIAGHYVNPPVASESYNAQQQQPLAQDKEHHYGRNAALAGGAGAAGAAGYAALQNDRGDTGPASKTIGPHKSNIANIVDPRVRPEPEKMKDHTTAGPWQSDTLNKLDPKVESDPNKADVKVHGYATDVAPQQVQHQQQLPADQTKDHHYGSDAAVIGGTGAAAYGATQAYDQHEQEKLAKEHEKQAQHEAKERAKEQEKQAKHDAHEADKQAKHDAKEAEKARSKEAEKHVKEQEKLDKHHAKEVEKAEEKRLKEQEKAEKERQKELEKLRHEKEKEDAKLAAARYDEAEAKHNKHNKLHKEAPEEREEKGGIIHRIFHHKHYEREGVEGSSTVGRTSGSFEQGRPVGEEAFDRHGTAGATGAEPTFGKAGFEQPGMGGEGDGMVTEPTTGLPMNIGKYGVGSGGTDANPAIAGHYGK